MKDNQRITLTKRLLKEALLRLMEIKPLEKINISELCKEAGINRATFYRHYELPKDVLNDIEHDLTCGLDMENWQIVSIQDVVHCCEVTLQYLYEHADILKILIQNRSDAEFTQAINIMCERIFDLRSNIKIIDNLDEDSVKLISSYSVGGIYFLLRTWLLEGVQKTPQEISQLVLQMFQL